MCPAEPTPNPELDSLDARISFLESKIQDLENLLQQIHPDQHEPDGTEPGEKGPASSPGDSPPLAGPLDPVTADIYRLSDTGRSILEIAEVLQMPVGKIELVLALRTP
ncbi:MAG: hypothetical protein CMJ32_08995 [Phycisphaerae bacterium]|nr:hypothetical protein [Phycisphaerae bacterium]